MIVFLYKVTIRPNISFNRGQSEVAIDARMIQHGSMHGIARYVYELLKGMNHMDTKIKFFVIINADSPLLADEETANIEKIVISSRWISFGEQVELPSILRANDIDLFHTPSFVAPLVSRVN